jgi:Kdo2-lipid IVA lauroyltransferase/acyltransferase
MKGRRKQFSAGKRLRFRLETLALRIVAWLVPKFPRRSVQRFAHGVGWLAYHLLRRERRIALANLDLAFDTSKSREEKESIARASVQNFAATVLCLFWAPRLTPAVVDKLAEVEPEGLHRVRELKAHGKPIIFITLHYGDWELLGLASGFLAIPMTVVQEAMRNEALEEVFGPLRGRSGHRIVPNRFAGVTLLKTLKRGGNIALLNDLNATAKRGGVWLDFFGVPVFNNAAAGALALRSGAAIVCGVAHPLPDGRTRIVYYPAIECSPTDDAKAINQQALNLCEAVIRAAPEHWLWSYKRWKFRPSEDWGNYPFYSRYWPSVVEDADK